MRKINSIGRKRIEEWITVHQKYFPASSPNRNLQETVDRLVVEFEEESNSSRWVNMSYNGGAFSYYVKNNEYDIVDEPVDSGYVPDTIKPELLNKKVSDWG